MNAFLSPRERLRLIKNLSTLPQSQFEQILFALNPPSEVISASASAQGSRATELLGWAEGPTGPTLESVLDLLSEYIPLDEVIPSKVSKTVSSVQDEPLASSIQNSRSRQKLVLEFPEGLVPIDSPFYVERPPLENDCYEAIERPGSLIRIKAPRLGC